jgi:peptide/nickel transport system substrate-binding protein/oligopeptide transport system substrate-binding protein
MRLRTTNALFSAALALVGALASLAGCSGFRSVTPECGACAQVLRLPGVGVADVSSLDPPNAGDLFSVQIVQMVFPGLVVLDKNLTPIPWAAQSLPTVSSDGLTWTFKVRPNLKWSDGAPITAETYAYSINRAENPCNAFGVAYYLFGIKDAVAFNQEKCDTATGAIKGPIQSLIGDSISAPDPLTLRIQLQVPATYFLDALTYPTSYAVPEQLIKQYGNKYIEHLADGAGFGGDLFKVIKWDHIGQIVLQRNDTFWGVKPKIGKVFFTAFKDQGTAYAEFLAGQYDVGSAPVSGFAQARKRPGFHQTAIQSTEYYAMNWRKAPFNDLRMRQAFAIALDKNTLANSVLRGTVQATNHIVPSGTPGYNPGLLGPDGTQSLDGNATLAHQLATSYATQTGCGSAADFSRCPPVVLTISANNTDALNEADVAQQMWLRAMPNYPITIDSVDFDTLLQETAAGRLQIWRLGWIEDYPDPQDWLTNNLACDNPFNTGHACDATADALMKAADENPDRTARLAQYQQAEQILVKDVAWVPLYQSTIWWETKPYVRNYSVDARGLVPKESWQTVYIAA